uniref:sulfiredoxin-1 isoform X1 n=1 Tax=Vespula vulgaris TaxID=7454 RepID=UPI00223BB660|nr:sulfiredoxin-1 isoform X1 [Vespula vulgaris]
MNHTSYSFPPLVYLHIFKSGGSKICCNSFIFVSHCIQLWCFFEQYASKMDKVGTSIHSSADAEVFDVPMSVIIRPFPPDVNEEKVQSLINTLNNSETESLVPPIDILWIKGSEGGDYYYSFGGCHRYTAHKQIGRQFIKAKLIKSTITDLRSYLGNSTPDLK